MNAGVTTLTLPDGGTMEIPLPGSKARFSLRDSSPAGCPNLVPTILIPLVVGVLIGVAATAYYMRRR